MIVYDKLLYSSKELFESYLHGKKYSIPPYQRGYKWDLPKLCHIRKNSF